MRCAECVYFFPADENTGFCRESPPKIFLVPVQSMAGQGIGFQSVFPQLHKEAWCGSFSGEETGIKLD